MINRIVGKAGELNEADAVGGVLYLSAIEEVRWTMLAAMGVGFFYNIVIKKEW